MLSDKLKKAVHDTISNELELIETDGLAISALARAGVMGSASDEDETEVRDYLDDMIIYLIMQIDKFR